MRIALASDHAGFALKEEIKVHLARAGHELQDCGAFSSEPSDYPDFGRDAARRVSSGKAERAVLICGSGIGMCMVANRVSGVRAAVLRDAKDAELARSHNDANVACLGARITGSDAARALVESFLAAPFDGGRHEARVRKIDKP